MNVPDRLIGKACDYLAAATAFTVAAIVLREVAGALDETRPPASALRKNLEAFLSGGQGCCKFSNNVQCKRRR